LKAGENEITSKYRIDGGRRAENIIRLDKDARVAKRENPDINYVAYQAVKSLHSPNGVGLMKRSNEKENARTRQNIEKSGGIDSNIMGIRFGVGGKNGVESKKGLKEKVNGDQSTCGHRAGGPLRREGKT